MIRYKAGGRLLGSVKLPKQDDQKRNRHLILVHSYNEQYVISVYIEGECSWVSGNYLDNFQDAIELFADKLKDLLLFE